MLDLVVEVVEVELVLHDLLLQLLGLFLIELLLGALHQGYHVAHTQDTVGHTRRMEGIDSLHLLTSTDKLDGLRHHRANRKGSTATGITVELGQHHAVEVQTVVEFLSCIHGILTGHRVHHKERLVWIHGILQRSNLVHHLLIHGQTTGGIDDDHVVVLGLSLADSILRNGNHVLVLWLGINGHANGLSHHVQLLDSSRTINVASHQQRALVLLRLQHIGQFAGEGGLTRTLQTRHQDDARLAIQFQAHGLAAHQFGQFIVNNLHHELSRLDGREHVHAHCLLLHGFSERFCHLVVHVSIKQCAAHILQGLSNVNFCDFSFTFKYLERPFKSVA